MESKVYKLFQIQKLRYFDLLNFSFGHLQIKDEYDVK